MPRIEGRKSTRVTVKFDDLDFENGSQSFVGTWEQTAYMKPCQIEGCDHIVSGVRNPNPDWVKDGEDAWVTCGEGTGASIVYGSQTGRRHYLLCICHTEEYHERLNEVWKERYGDPE